MSPLRTALVSQLVGGLIAVAAIQIIQPRLLALPLVCAMAQGVCAALASHKLGAPRWWTAIHLIFLPLAVSARQLDIPPFAWLGGFTFLLLLFWRTDKSQVPLYLSNRRTACAVANMLSATPCHFIDLGCGTGSLLCHLAKTRPDSTFTGIEHAPLPFLLAWLRSLRVRNLTIRYGNFWHENLGSYHAIYAFLSPVPMAKLWEKACREMPDGSLLISNSFEIPGRVPDHTVTVPDQRRTRLLCYLPATDK